MTDNLPFIAKLLDVDPPNDASGTSALPLIVPSRLFGGRILFPGTHEYFVTDCRGG
jgi:hypothetical protein